MRKYLEKVKPYLIDMINNFKKSKELKIQLPMKPKSMSSTDSNEKRMLHNKNDNTEIMIGKDTDEIIQ